MSVTVHEVLPYIRVRGAEHAIAFYAAAFGAEEIFRLTEPGGRIGHAEMRIGPAKILLSDEYPEFGIGGPESVGGTTFSIHLHVDDVDTLFARAVAAGAAVVRPLQNEFYGERGGTLRDPFGHEWLLGQQIEVVSVDEMQRRFDALCQPSDA